MKYICDVKLTLQIKLLPSGEQAKLLKSTIERANQACNYISEKAFESKVYNSVKLHHLTYYDVREKFGLSSQLVVRCIAKVSDSYKIDKKIVRAFKKFGAISYDSRIINYKPNNIVSIACLIGRIKMPYVCHNSKMKPFIKGECDLVYRKRKFFLFQTIDVPDGEISDVEEFIGVDFGQTDIAVTSDGIKFSSSEVKKVRKHYSKVRSSLQKKGTKGAKRALKRLSGKEHRFVYIQNHTISKKLISKAKREGKGIAIEDLSNIRKTAKPKSKKMKTELNRWPFFQLRKFLAYKATRDGVKLVVIPPEYTSQTCSCCKHRGVEKPFRKGKNFECLNCGYTEDADINAALNISIWGRIISRPEKSTLFCSLHSL